MTRTRQGLHGTLLPRLLWPTGVLFASTLWIVFSTILWTSDGMNTVAADRQQAQFAAAIDQQIAEWANGVEELVGALAVSPDDVASAAGRARLLGRIGNTFHGYAGVFVMSGPDLVGGSVDGGRVAALPSALATLIRAAATVDPENPLHLATGNGRIVNVVAHGRDTLAILTAPMLAPADRSADTLHLVALRRVGEADIAGIARVQGLRDFVVSDKSDATRRSIAVTNERGAPARFYTWIPDSPGNLVRERLVPLTTIGFAVALVLFCGIAFYLRSVVKDLAHSQARSEDLVGRDPLSGLANRLRFAERLDQELGSALKSDHRLAVLFIDLDRFKDVNDTYGHQAGDTLIQQVASRIASVLSGTDVLARFGGDEFAIIQVGIRDAAESEHLARQILERLSAPFLIGPSTHITIGASLGIALAPEHGSDRETLMRLADTALYQAKSEGRNRYSFFHRKMDETLRMRKVVEDDLRHAIDHDELQLFYQPLVSSDGEHVVGVEALVRWPHPTRGMISPGEFIAIAEERGLIIPLSEWVLRRACLDGQRWPELRIAVNVSAIEFRHRDFVERVLKTLQETGFDPTRLELELTEGVVVADADAAETAIMELRAVGVNLALDDFGTGYSSLIYLRRFAFDKIKIDRSFLESMEATGESAILVHSIVHLGRALGLTVTAEGVETREQHRFLQALGCHQLQGYLFSKPVPAAEIDKILLPEREGLGIAPAAA